jgi:hypothetical protein
MRRGLLLLPIVGAVSMMWVGCGGSTADFAAGPTPDGGDNGIDGGSGGAANVGTGGGTSTGGGSVAGGGGGPSFDPGSIGGIVGGGLDAGGVIADAGGAGPISPVVVDGCNALCTKEATANCPNQGTVENCVIGCRLLLNNPNCTVQTATLFACEKDSPASCNAEGKATLSGCPVEQLSSAVCFLQNAKDPTLKGPCTTYCAAVAATQCPNDDVAGCQAGCQVIGNFIPACNDYWKSYVTCASTATLTCGMDGKAGAPACVLEFGTYALCTLGGVLNVGDAGR